MSIVKVFAQNESILYSLSNGTFYLCNEQNLYTPSQIDLPHDFKSVLMFKGKVAYVQSATKSYHYANLKENVLTEEQPIVCGEMLGEKVAVWFC